MKKAFLALVLASSLTTVSAFASNTNSTSGFTFTQDVSEFCGLNMSGDNTDKFGALIFNGQAAPSEGDKAKFTILSNDEDDNDVKVWFSGTSVAGVKPISGTNVAVNDVTYHLTGSGVDNASVKEAIEFDVDNNSKVLVYAKVNHAFNQFQKADHTVTATINVKCDD